MKFIADFHIHSHYSVATSKNLIPEFLEYWARLKGINVLGTGDCLHPGWLAELEEKLEPTPNGFFRLKSEYRLDLSKSLAHPKIPDEVYFILTGEISNIYKKEGKVRKVHNLLVFPDFKAVKKVQNFLDQIGNIRSDGRPILGLDSKIVLEKVLESSDLSTLIPAHIWTPWFSVLGSKSGFDNLEECYEDLTPYIFAVETGLSSDPPMNWMCSFLDKFRLVSNSDAHSPEKLGREANLFETELSYSGIYQALKEDQGFLGTIEFFPQEGKYHYDGHRKCDLCWNPLETVLHQGICPVCHKPVTKGVMYRVAELADRGENENLDINKDFYSITQLPEILSELFKIKNSRSKKIQSEYFNLIKTLGSEFNILLTSEINEIKNLGSELLAEGIRRLRLGEVIVQDGFDGEFGRVKLFSPEELNYFLGNNLFSLGRSSILAVSKKNSVKFNLVDFRKGLKDLVKQEVPGLEKIKEGKNKKGENFNLEQKKGIEHYQGLCLVMAGPGSGKTRILIERIVYLIKEQGINPKNILPLTFSNKAAEEIRERLRFKKIEVPQVFTFHALGMKILKEHSLAVGREKNFYIVDEEERQEILINLSGESRQVKKVLQAFDRSKQGQELQDDFKSLFEKYNEELKKRKAFDLGDLVYLPVILLTNNSDLLAFYQKQYPWLLVDEYQDINAIQYQLLKLLGGDSPNLFAIGDPNQAIYGFRGSSLAFLDFLFKDYPKTKTIQLERSYRCPARVLKVGEQILQKQNKIVGQDCKLKIFLQKEETDKSEADWIARQIENLLGGVRSFSLDSGLADGQAQGYGFSDFAVLCRSSFMFEEIIKAFENHGLAYQVVGEKPFYKEEPYQTFLTLLKKVYHLKAGQDFSVPGVNTLPEVKKSLIDLISQKAPLLEILKFWCQVTDWSDDQFQKINDFLKPFGNNYQDFFIRISLGQGEDDYRSQIETISLMTLHASKGLEFRTVFIPGCEQGIIPFELFGVKDQEELEEEKRLLYVGMTRTKESLYLSYAKKRLYKGRILKLKRSKFLDQVEKGLLDFQERKIPSNFKKDTQLELFSDTKSTKD